MNDVQYRAYREEDAPRVKALLDEAFFISRYAGGAGPLLDAALEVYLRQILTGSTFSEVAVLDGRVVGVITARVKGEPYLPDRMRNRMIMLANIAKALALGITKWRVVLQYVDFDRAYVRLRPIAVEKKGDLGDELTVFAVDSSTRGTGIGGRLYGDFCEHLRAAGHSAYYLYTDSLCSVGFYEKRGMERTAETDIELDVADLPSQVGVYLYTGTV